ncbi:MAG: BMP family ABC transporter substrate-binding protein [Eubacteriaceae bacterium]|nr:BMP family ABC transporter substrate-binding protein [Eubacteriaceae bacterium]
MKKLLAVLLAGLMLLSFAACGDKEDENTAIELALVTDKGTIDDRSFNQGAWEGLVKYATENNITYQYYQPVEQSMNSYYDTIKIAVDAGAKVVVCPGYLFENAVHKAQKDFPEVKFIFIDGAPSNVTDASTMATYDNTDPDYTIAENTYSIFYKEEQAGFLAGYAAVKEGFTKLGFMGGMAVPAVVRFGYGYVQGAEYAAKEMGVEVEMKYHYTGDFSATPEAQAKAAAWYTSGTEIIFGCGGAVGNSAMAAATAAGGKYVIGVDVDQSGESDTVITSAMKDLAKSVYDGIAAFYAGTFPGGKSLSLGADVNGVGLPMATSKFTTFTQADYDAIYAALAADTDGIASTMVTEAEDATKLPVTKVTVVLD